MKIFSLVTSIMIAGLVLGGCATQGTGGTRNHEVSGVAASSSSRNLTTSGNPLGGGAIGGNTNYNNAAFHNY